MGGKGGRCLEESCGLEEIALGMRCRLVYLLGEALAFNRRLGLSGRVIIEKRLSRAL